MATDMQQFSEHLRQMIDQCNRRAHAMHEMAKMLHEAAHADRQFQDRLANVAASISNPPLKEHRPEIDAHQQRGLAPQDYNNTIRRDYSIAEVLRTASDGYNLPDDMVEPRASPSPYGYHYPPNGGSSY